MSRASLGTALLLALAGTAAPSAGAAPHPPRVERVSTAADGTQADGPSNDAALSADGRHAAFVSTAPGFGCARFTPCLLVKDLTGGGVTGIGLGSGYTYGSPMPSADGSRIAFSAGTRFLAPYLYDRATGRAEQLWPENPPGSNELGRVRSISPDGRHVAYTIGNRNGDQNFRLLYVRDTATGTDELISPAEEGDKPGASVSGDGERVAYSVRSDSEEDPADVFVKDRATGERAQVDTGLGAAFLVRITADGRRVLLEAEGGLYVHDLRTGTSRRVAEGTTSSATADGRYAVVSDTDGTRVRDLRTGLPGAALPPSAQVMEGALADKGRAVAFSSTASHLVPGDTNAESDVFVFSGDLRQNPAPMPSVTERISMTGDGQQRPWASYDPVMGADKVVAFTSDDNVFRFNGGTTDVVSAPTGKAAGNPSISYDGRYIAFEQGGGVHVRDLDTGVLEQAGAGGAYAPSLSEDGRRVAFQQGDEIHVRDLDAGTTSRVRGTEPSLSGSGTHLAYTSQGVVYLLELATGKRQSVSVDRWGGRNDLPARHPSANADGTVVAFESASPDLVEGDTNGGSDVFLRTVQ